MDDLTTTCPVNGCDALVTSIERYHVTAEWTLGDDGWSLGTWDNGTHFHLFCEQGHESKWWGHELPQRIQDVVYPGSATPP